MLHCHKVILQKGKAVRGKENLKWVAGKGAELASIQTAICDESRPYQEAFLPACSADLH